MSRPGEPGEASAVERVAEPTAEEFRRRWIEPRRPVIITGAMESWPARRAWSPDYLRARYGERRVPVARVAGGDLARDARTGIPYDDDVTLGEFLDRALGPGPADGYAMFLLHQALPELDADLASPAFAPPAPWSIRKLWLSAADVRSPLHQDLPENLFAQVYGRKRVTLFPPSEELRMYRHAPWSRLPQVSRADAEAPDDARFPRLRHARRFTAVVEPGELLYIPALWWHQLRSLSFSISVNTWWATGWSYGLVRAALAYQRLRALRY